MVDENDDESATKKKKKRKKKVGYIAKWVYLMRQH